MSFDRELLDQAGQERRDRWLAQFVHHPDAPGEVEPEPELAAILHHYNDSRSKTMMLVAPVLAIAGGTVGAALTFWMGRVIGEKGLERHVPEKRLKKLRRRIRESGAVTLAVLDLVPPPFPSTLMVLAAGALKAIEGHP